MTVLKPLPAPSEAEIRRLRRELEASPDQATLDVQGQPLTLLHLGRELWPPWDRRPALTKRGLLVYLAGVAPYLLPHLKDRPLTLNRYPGGIGGVHFFQKHWNAAVPDFVQTVPLTSEHIPEAEPYILCNNLPTLLWLGAEANLEFHSWYSRVTPGTDLPPEAQGADLFSAYPDFVVFDLDPYIYSGQESPGEEPELNRAAFKQTAAVARRLKEHLEAARLTPFVKTSGKTGLHVFVPIQRRFTYAMTRTAAEAVGRRLVKEDPDGITLEWVVKQRAGKIFVDFNQNVRGKTLASLYSPRPTPEASVSMPLDWAELEGIYPPVFTLCNVPGIVRKKGDAWVDILKAAGDLGPLLDALGLR
jgi:bifunctional non-homologous end joining protein LigD